MTTKTTFEDRLLAELRGEIERREEDSSVPAVRRRLFTGRQLALAAAACAVAGLAVVLVPGSPAYAVERHGDGNVTLTLNDLTPNPVAQRELTERLRENGIDVDIQNLDSTHKCKRPRGESILGNDDVIPSPAAESEAKASEPPNTPKQARNPADAWKITLHRGDTLAFENNLLQDSKSPGSVVRAVTFYAVKGAIEPCVQVERPNPVLEGVTTHSSKG